MWASTKSVSSPSPLIDGGEVRLHVRPDPVPVGMAGGPLGQHHLGDDPRLEELGVGAAGEVVVERRGPTEAGGVDVADDGPAAGAAADGDEPLHLEQPQALPHALAGQPGLLEHDCLGGELVAGAQTRG